MTSTITPWWVSFSMVLFYIISVSTNLTGQESFNFEKIGSISVQSKLSAITPLGKVLAVTQDNILIQYDSNGNELNRYSNQQKGDITSIHCENPFSILIDYADYRVTQVLDKTLSFSEEFSLDDFFNSTDRILTLSRDNHLWIYDEIEATIKKISFKGAVLFESNALNLFFQTVLQPNWLVEYENQLFLNEPNIGILVFDNFGKYEKTIALKGLDQFAIIDQRIIYREKGQYHQFHLKSLLHSQIQLPDTLHRSELLFAGDLILVKHDQNLEILKQKVD